MKERGALQELSQDSSIVIKRSDKGGLLVIQDASKYQEEVIHQLSDENI